MKLQTLNSEFTGIYFMHIPKTAGTAFNAIFRDVVPEDRFFDHMESNLSRFEEIKGENFPFFVSGHFPYDLSQGYIRRRDVFSLTILRNPVEHFLSHLKWLKAYGEPTEQAEKRRTFLQSEIAQLSIELWDTSLNDVEKLSELFETPIARMIFDNAQVRYMTGFYERSVKIMELDEARANFRNFNFVFVLEDIDAAVTYLKNIFPAITSIERSNTAVFNEELDWNDRKVLDFYRTRVGYDAELFTEVRQYSREMDFEGDFQVRSRND